MEEKSGVTRRTAGIIRAIFIIFVLVLLIFFVVRFFRHREQRREAERQVAESSQSSSNSSRQGDDSKGSDEENTDRRDSESSSPDDSSSSETTDLMRETPRGLADGTGVDSGVREVPETGMGENVAAATIGISAVVYTALRHRQSRRELIR